ncbi:glycoside hydrolase family 30 beta sandwich domain-containing protein [Streptomyces sp. NBC_01190]|uniref:glycoside hydrolase family 30 beta sandwich domain-containing protein n=1 Tax=Streptomyces sp. NBC_01190 TaxID=2903767 RepID=UPI00386B6D82|nr:glycoside hydrolase family 30 protein [Streptomyces sp. NBC_01190]
MPRSAHPKRLTSLAVTGLVCGSSLIALSQSPASAASAQTAMTGANLNAFLYWWGISNTSHDSSLIGLNGSMLTPSKRFYALANFSRFVRPQATRIAASSGNGNLEVSAYHNTNGTIALVVLNTGTSAATTSYTATRCPVPRPKGTPTCHGQGKISAFAGEPRRLPPRWQRSRWRCSA